MPILKITLPAGITADQIRVDFSADSEVVVDTTVVTPVADTAPDIAVPENATSTVTPDVAAPIQ